MNKTDKKSGMVMAGIVIILIAAAFNINAAASNGEKQTGDDEQRKADNKVLLEIFKNFRVADVRDAMDWIGYHN
ncbi:MAG: hypothetical protein LBE91_12295, partial [Tannerella sp.]|nr:hypothetical protein [Tannerella sp.]